MTSTTWRAAALAAALLTLAGCTTSAPTAEPSPQADAVEIRDPWVKAADSGMTAAFARIENRGDADVTVVAVSSPASAGVQLHETVADGSGTSTMQQIPELTIPSGASRTLEAGGDHLMLMDIARPLVPGDEIVVTLEFADGSTLDFRATVKDFAGADEEYVGGMGLGDDGSMDMGDDG